MRTCFLSCCPLACFAVFVAAGVSSAKTPPLPPDFGSDDAWRDHDIALVRVVRVEPNGKEPPTVYLRTERSYTGQKDTGDTTVPLSAISFGYDRPAGSRFARPRPVSVKVGDELVVWPNHWQHPAQRYLPGTKIVGPADKSPLVQTLEQIAKIRAAGGRAPGFGFQAEIERVAKLRAAGGEAAAKGGVLSPDSTVVRYALSVLETMPPKKADEAFADRLRAFRAGASQPLSVRLPANRLLPRYSAGPEEARAEAVEWLHTLFATNKGTEFLDLWSIANEIFAETPKREDLAAFFISVVGDDTKPQPVRMASIVALQDSKCFDYKQAGSRVSSDIFSAMLSLLKSKEKKFREVGAVKPGSICVRIRSRGDQIARAQEAISAISAAIDAERDAEVLAYMKARRSELEGILKAPPLMSLKEIQELKARMEKKAREAQEKDRGPAAPPAAAQGPPT